MSAQQKLLDVYRQRVLEHSREPHNCRHMDEPDRHALGFNPLCGDKITVYLGLRDDQLTEVCFEGAGCAISIASASMMTDSVTGRSTDNVRRMISEIQAMLLDGETVRDTNLNELQALEGVRDYPSRIKCATLAWTTLDAALNNTAAQVSTE